VILPETDVRTVLKTPLIIKQDTRDGHRPYLEQRHATAVAYLNDPGEEFGGGVLEFRDGHPQSVSPQSGSMVRSKNLVTMPVAPCLLSSHQRNLPKFAYLLNPVNFLGRRSRSWRTRATLTACRRSPAASG